MPTASPVTKTVMPRSLKPVSLSGEAPKARPMGPPGLGVPAAPAAAAPAPVIPDKEIHFQLGDFAEKIPPGILKPGRLDLQRVVTFHSADLVADLARGRASVRLSKLLDLCPDIFQQSVIGAQDDQGIPLPLQKLVEQIGDFQTRTDQVDEETPTKTFDTPFLKGAIADGAAPVPVPGASFLPKPTTTVRATNLPAPTLSGAVHTEASAIPKPPVPIMPPGMRPPPATVRATVSGGKIKIGGGAPAPVSPPVLPPASAPTPVPVLRSIPMSVAPAPQVPAAVPSPVPAPVEAVTPPKSIPMPGFKLPSQLPATPPTLSTGAIPTAHAAGGERVLSGNIRLGLRKILESLPAMWVQGDLSNVDADAVLEFPMALIQPQIKSGKVAVPVATFQTALPEKYRSLLGSADATAEIPLPLREIISNLPQEAIIGRTDQVEVVPTHEIPTPFSDKAREDATRFQKAPEPAPEVGTAANPSAVAPTTPAVPPVVPVVESPKPAPLPSAPLPVPAQAIKPSIPKPFPAISPAVPVAAEPVPPPVVPVTPTPVIPAAVAPSVPVAVPAVEPAKPAKPFIKAEIVDGPQEQIPEPLPDGQDDLRAVFMTDENLDARRVAALARDFPGIESVIICTADGLQLASAHDGPSHDLDAVCAIAPHFFQRVSGYCREIRQGGLRSFTVDSEQGLASFFLADSLCVIVRHKGRDFYPGVRDRFTSIARALARTYSRPTEY